MTFEELCKHFDRNAPTPFEEPVSSSLFFCEPWDNGNDSINDILVRFLKKRGYHYLYKHGMVWFLFGGKWTCCDVRVSDGRVYFYINQYAD